MATNITYYTTQTLYFPVPTTSTYVGLGYTRPSTGQWSASGTGLPTVVNQVPQLVLPTTGGINAIIGYVAGTFPTSSIPSVAKGKKVYKQEQRVSGKWCQLSAHPPY